MATKVAKPKKAKIVIDTVNKQFYSVLDARLISVIKQMATKGDINRIIKMKVGGGGDKTTSKISSKTRKRKLGPLSDCFRERNVTQEIFPKTIDYKRHNNGIPIPMKKFQEWIKEAIFYHGEPLVKGLVVEYLIWIDRGIHTDWGDLYLLNKKRYIGYMTRDEIIFLGVHRKAIKELRENNLYRPLCVTNYLRWDMHYDAYNRITKKATNAKGKKHQRLWSSADLVRKEDIIPMFPNLWIGKGDIEFYEIDSKTKRASIRSIPIKLVRNGKETTFNSKPKTRKVKKP